MSISVASCSLNTLFKGPFKVTGNCETQGKFATSELLEITGELTIPDYQRPYCWQAAQMQRLLNDYAAYVKAKVKRPTLPFYLGSIILHHDKAEEKEKLNIIDGQQRLTTLGLVAFIQGKHKTLGLRYQSPESQQQIRRNLIWLQKELSGVEVNLDDITVTIVVTDSVDNAYRFFETQNTGGKRLSGPDIIKAYHLRAINKAEQNKYARTWEDLDDLKPIVELLLKGRWWRNLNFRNVPSHRQQVSMKEAIVDELGEQAGTGEDIGYGRVVRIFQSDGSQLQAQAQQAYELRQPLNAGVNTIHYLAYFEQLRKKYLTANFPVNNNGFQKFYCGLILQLEGCYYIKKSFDICLLLYISQFGDKHLEIAAKKIFRVVYSPRLTNQKTVREDSVPSFFKHEAPVLDWIVNSYTPTMCFDYLDAFNLKVDPRNLEADHNGVKKRFVKKVRDFFDLSLGDGDIAKQFGEKLDEEILGYKGKV